MEYEPSGDTKPGITSLGLKSSRPPTVFPVHMGPSSPRCPHPFPPRRKLKAEVDFRVARGVTFSGSYVGVGWLRMQSLGRRRSAGGGEGRREKGWGRTSRWGGGREEEEAKGNALRGLSPTPLRSVARREHGGRAASAGNEESLPRDGLC